MIKRFDNFIFWFVVTLFANSYVILKENWWLLAIFLPAFFAVNLLTGFFYKRIKSKRLKLCYHGGCLLLIFVTSTFVSIVYHVIALFFIWPGEIALWLWSVLVCTLVEGIIFWNGIISVYCTSVQLGIRRRVIGIVCGLIPVLNLIVLGKFIKVVFAEIRMEVEKDERNKEREHLKICETKYPIVLIHGVFFRDSHLLNYWGRIPAELEKNGAAVYYGEHESARPVAESAKELTVRIKRILEDHNCEKVNIIAHSKGALDCRYAMHHLGMAPHVASLTTINTPHRGCVFAEYLLEKVPSAVVQKVADTYNASFKALGDKKPDFIAAVTDLTASVCTIRDVEFGVPKGIFCQSVGSKLNRATSGRFPMNFSYHFVKHFDGPNDGLVSEDSFAWGEKYTLLTVKGRRGISHGDMVDLNRENIPEFDVREFYVQLVADLKERGL